MIQQSPFFSQPFDYFQDPRQVRFDLSTLCDLLQFRCHQFGKHKISRHLRRTYSTIKKTFVCVYIYVLYVQERDHTSTELLLIFSDHLIHSSSNVKKSQNEQPFR